LPVSPLIFIRLCRVIAAMRWFDMPSPADADTDAVTSMRWRRQAGEAGEGTAQAAERPRPVTAPSHHADAAAPA